MADAKKPQPIVIKKIKKITGGGHGAAWKIAYADFVTAMMAFFLLMWLLGSTTKAQLQGIAEYFQNPQKVSLEGGSGAGSATSVIQGGGTDLTRTTGQVRDGATPGKVVKPNATTAKAEEVDKKNLEALKKVLEAQIQSDPQLNAFRSQLLIDITREGLRIQVVDSEKRPMFSLGGAQLESYARTIFQDIAPTLNQLPNSISITGHTDALSYQNQGRGYSNYNLSADRANAVRQVMVQAGLSEPKVLRVVGMGSAAPFDPKNPNAPLNRRVSIVVLSRQAAARILADQSVVHSASMAPEALANVASGAASAPAGALPVVAPAPPPPNPATDH